MDKLAVRRLVDQYKSDSESVYNTWFIGGQERMKAFRAIRQGVRDAVDSIAAGTFGNDFKGSPLEVVLTTITEQKQIFEGAAHPFFWKPKLRIPDIYENESNKRKFGAFLESCLNATREDQILTAMSRLAAMQIKGLGPSVANIVYFLHPTLIPPINTAMMNGFNALFDDKKKLGSWEAYLGMRQTLFQTNDTVRSYLSKDLGAFAGLLYELGIGRLIHGGSVPWSIQLEKAKAEKAAQTRHNDVVSELAEESEHTHMQYMLIQIGRALHYNVYIARNDRHREWEDQLFSMLTVPDLPPFNWSPEVLATVRLIDVIWLEPDSNKIVG